MSRLGVRFSFVLLTERKALAMVYMSKRFAKRIDPLFPNTAGVEHLAQVRKDLFRAQADVDIRVGETCFHPKEVEHLQKALAALADDEAAQSTLMSLICFTQMKVDCAF